MDAQKQNEFPISAVVIAATTLRCLVQNGCHLSNANVAKQTYHCLSSEEAKNQSCTPKIDKKKHIFQNPKMTRMSDFCCILLNGGWVWMFQVDHFLGGTPAL